MKDYMNGKIFSILFALLFLFSTICIGQYSQPYALTVSSKADSAAITKTQRTIKALMNKARIPGLSVAVAKEGEIIYSEGFGSANIENGLAVNPDTKFRIGSLSKQLTATVMMKMYEEEVINIDSPIMAYMDSLPNQYNSITSRQLAGHLAGIRHYKEGGYFNTKEYESVKESLEIFVNDTLLFQPGSKQDYSTYGYVLLSAVLAEIADKPFLQLVRDKLLEPLSMNSTVADYRDKIIFRRAEFYTNNDEGALINALSENYSYKWAGGGYLSTAEDLVKFGSSLISGTYLEKEILDEMFASQETTSGEKTGYGIGWRIDEDWEGRSIVRHGGSSSGSRAFFMLYPDDSLAIAILTNKEGAPIFEGEAGVIADYFLDKYDSTLLEKKIEGVYKYTRSVDGKNRHGILNIIKSENGYQGSISNIYSYDASILNIQEVDEQTVISAATTSGIVNFWLIFDEKGFEGKYGWDEPSNEISGLKLGKK